MNIMKGKLSIYVSVLAMFAVLIFVPMQKAMAVVSAPQVGVYNTIYGTADTSPVAIQSASCRSDLCRPNAIRCPP